MVMGVMQSIGRLIEVDFFALEKKHHSPNPYPRIQHGNRICFFVSWHCGSFLVFLFPSFDECLYLFFQFFLIRKVENIL